MDLLLRKQAQQHRLQAQLEIREYIILKYTTIFNIPFIYKYGQKILALDFKPIPGTGIFLYLQYRYRYRYAAWI